MTTVVVPAVVVPATNVTVTTMPMLGEGGRGGKEQTTDQSDCSKQLSHGVLLLAQNCALAGKLRLFLPATRKTRATTRQSGYLKSLPEPQPKTIATKW
jgi:hypothetical protein